ncbi:hypothetical protein KVR01_004611 [Diaporthe batatas]|uniref:uncharacterized protein n=1 Tax=Diaporthe batatas TaxID=748121 RepID=UPI001D045CA8|nr:uncharacterized protein KVR01_004611 [Diaporthe batatas]KAG8166059.1 hypothetical protein KVR01_004611 [Diaporthe batatas]
MQDGSWSRSDHLSIFYPPTQPFSSSHLNPTPESSLGPRALPPTRWSVWQAWGLSGNRAYEIITRKLGTLYGGMNSMPRPRPSSLASTMTPRLHGSPLAALSCTG